MIFRFRASTLSMNAASRARMMSSTPPASPALIMLTYSLSKALGCLASASENEDPVSKSSATSPVMFLSAEGFIWLERILMLRTMGSPASMSTESCSVNCVSCLCRTLPPRKLKPFFFGGATPTGAEGPDGPPDPPDEGAGLFSSLGGAAGGAAASAPPELPFPPPAWVIFMGL